MNKWMKYVLLAVAILILISGAIYFEQTRDEKNYQKAFQDGLNYGFSLYNAELVNYSMTNEIVYLPTNEINETVAYVSVERCNDALRTQANKTE